MPFRAGNTSLEAAEAAMAEARALRWLLAGLAAAVLVTAVGTFVAGRVALTALARVEQERATLADLAAMDSVVLEAASAHRGFLASGDPQELAGYDRARAEAGRGLASLRTRAAEGTVAPGDVEEVAGLVGEMFAALASGIEERRSGATAPTVASAAGRVDATRARIDALRGSGERELAAARTAATRLSRLRTLVFVGFTLADLLFVAWVFARIRREIARSARIRAALEREGELVEVTLASIGDGVIVTDVAARVMFLNDVAAELTGWSRDEARGHPCGDVFRIVNQETRTSERSPIDRVLATGRVAGLANHTMLLRRDGGEIPIADSGAPIRDAAGALHGVVLVFRDVSESKQVESELRTAKDQAELASRAKDRFVAVLSHELRTPLTPVLATLSAWQERGGLPADVAADVALLRRNVELEVRLIDDLLDMTRMAAGKLKLAPKPVDVHEVVRAVLSSAAPEAAQKGVSLVDALEAERFHALVDPERLQQVFSNVIGNAIKFSPEGTAVRIQSTSSPAGEIVMQVSDQGLGMTPETLARVFEPFEQGSHERVRGGGGLGLGMTIARTLIEALGGGISATSAGPGRGSTFTVTLPILPHTESREEPPSAAPEPQVSDAAPLRVLLVEDHEDSAYAMRRVLELMGHVVVVRGDLTSALAEIEAAPYDLLLSDIGLPDGDGFDLVAAVRARSSQPAIPAIALTGFGMEEDIARARAAGFDAHLTKPVDFGKLAHAVDTLARPAMAAAAEPGPGDSLRAGSRAPG
jgi:PAS domain S-box-containing protein